MKYSKLVEVYEALSSTTKRLEKTQILAHFLKQLDEKEKDVLYLLEGRIFPSHYEKNLGINSQIAIKTLSQSTGISTSDIVRKWRSTGDLGETAEELCKNKKQSTLFSKDLNVENIIENLRKLPEIEGKGAIDKKSQLIAELFSRSSGKEAKYLMRTLLSDLRIGIKESTIRDALAEAFYPENKKEAIEKIASALETSNDIGEVFIRSKRGLKELDSTKLKVGTALKVMLAQKAKNIEEGFKTVGKPAAIEYKYDGFRLLINKDEHSNVSMFTRRLENVTKQFPEVAEYVKKYVKGSSFIIDSEVVGYDGKTHEYLPFQSISQRIKRKYDIEEVRAKFPIELNVFDILYYENKSLLKEPFKKRSQLLRKIIKSEKWKIIPAKQIITDNEKEAEKFYKEALKNNQEGVMMKNLEAEYKPGSRVGYMLKIKPSENDLDLVIVGAEYGTGKRGGWLSSFILACKHEGNFLEIGRVSTGLKEKEEQGVSFIELTNLLKPLITEDEGRIVKVQPKIVVSVTYQEIQRSPSYSSGFALRFPRFRALRPDRGLHDIASLSEIKKEYDKQRE